MSDTTPRDADPASSNAPTIVLSDDRAWEQPLSDAAGHRITRIVTLILTTTGALLLLAAAWAAVDELRFAARAEAADGLVVSLRRDTNGGTAPILRFTTADGRLIVAETNLFTSPPAWRVGERAPVRYDPAQPEHASPDTFMSRWFVALVLGVLGTAMLAAITVVRRFLRR